MPWAELDHTREITVPRKPRASAAPPKLTLYKDGLAKLNASARAVLGGAAVHLLHDPDQPTLVGIGTSGENPHKLSKTGTLSAVPLWRHAGRPTEAVHVPLRRMGDILVGDLSQAHRGRSASVEASEVGRPAPVAQHETGSVDGVRPRPEATAPSDSSALDVVYEPVEDYEAAY